MPRKRKGVISQHLETPQKARVRGTIEYLKAKGIKHSQKEVFEFFDIKRDQGYYAVQSSSDRRHHNNPETSEHRSPDYILLEKDLDECERILEQNGWNGHHLS